jgi:hypothetical protein
MASMLTAAVENDTPPGAAASVVDKASANPISDRLRTMPSL